MSSWPKAIHGNGEYTLQRRLVSLQADVGGGHTDGATDLQPVDHAPHHGIRTPKQPFRQAEIALLQGFTNARAANALVIERERTHVADAETQPVPRLLEHGVIALAIPAELEIVPHHEVAHAKHGNEEPFHHLGSRNQPRAVVERYAEHAVNAGATQDVNLLPKPRQPRRHRSRRPLGLATLGCLRPRPSCGGEELAWLRFEGDEQARRPKFLALGLQVRKQHLVPVMNAIKVANGRNAVRVAVTDIMQAADDLHAGSVSELRRRSQVALVGGHRPVCPARRLGTRRTLDGRR